MSLYALTIAQSGERKSSCDTPLMSGLRAIGAKQEEEWLAKAGPDGRAMLERYRALLRQ